MAALAPHPAVRALRRRQRAGVLGRRVGWVLLPLVVLSTLAHYAGGAAIEPWVPALVAAVAVLNTVHLALAVYVFGLVAPRRSLKVLHIYLGYLLGALIWASQTNLDREPLHTWLTVVMFAAIGAHLVLAARYAAQRRVAQHAASILSAR